MTRVSAWSGGAWIAVLLLAGCGSKQDNSDALNTADEFASAKTRKMAEVMRLQIEADRVNRDPNATPEQKQAAQDKYLLANMKMGRRDHNVQQPVLDLPPEWAATHRVEKNAKEAELLVQVGDIDNLGFGWPEKFDPFSGKTTPVHRFPWLPEADDPPGTDRIMVNSGAPVMVSAKDGYRPPSTSSTRRAPSASW